MARISFSPLIVEASGKVADTVFSRWKGRAYIRSRVTPANPNTAAQQAVRNSLARCVEMWQSLETEITDAWNLYASPYQISGFNAWMKFNRASEQLSIELMFTPVHADVDPVESYVAASGSSSGEIDLTWANGTQGAGYYVYVAVRKTGEDFFVLFEKATTLTSAEALTVTGLVPGVDYQVACSNEETTDSIFARGNTDTATALA